MTRDPTKLADMLHAAFSAGEPAADALREEREAAPGDEDRDEERTREERASIRRLETVLQTAPDSAPEDGSGDDDESSAVGALPVRT